MTHSKMRLIVASNNSNKLREFHEILGERFDIVSMHEAGIDADIEENGTTFEENALIKANYVMNAIQNGTAPWHFVEIMCCPGGCVNGGGQRAILRPTRRRRRE